MKRVYSSVIEEHFRRHRQMVFLIGPRQAGKTTVSLMEKEYFGKLAYLNWDNLDHRKVILKGVGSVAVFAGLDKLAAEVPLVIFDEIHKY